MRVDGRGSVLRVSRMVLLVLFGLAALAGVTMAVMVARGRSRPPTAIAVAHGAAAGAALVGLGFAVAGGDIGGLGKVALWVFMAAALGGATMFIGFHLRKRALPKPVIAIHGLVAVTGFVLLLIALLGI